MDCYFFWNLDWPMEIEYFDSRKWKVRKSIKSTRVNLDKYKEPIIINHFIVKCRTLILSTE
jgi:hypothetical protein